MHRTGIVVGIDDTPAAAHAYRWAVARSPQFGPVQPVAAWTDPWWYKLSAPMTAPDGPGPDIAKACTDLVEHLTARTDPALRGEPVIAKGAAGPILVDVGSGASLLVTGTRGRGPIADSLLGSVSTYCASHARVPVAVVPDEAPVEPEPGPILVGVDGSPGSAAALDWALAHAGDDDPITALQAWDIPILTGYEGVAIDPTVVRDGALQTATGAVAAACERAGVPPSRVDTKVMEGDARILLRDQGEHASLVVVGRRGSSRIAQLLLGSVAASLVHRPTAPIVVVPRAV
jgi:nucleotide-binding universal stress UspA family protein